MVSPGNSELSFVSLKMINRSSARYLLNTLFVMETGVRNITADGKYIVSKKTIALIIS